VFLKTFLVMLSYFVLLIILKFLMSLLKLMGPKLLLRVLVESCFLSLNLKHVLLNPNCPFNLLFLSQLTKSLNCSLWCKFFVIQEYSTGWLIGEGHEYGGFCYLGTRLLMFFWLPYLPTSAWSFGPFTFMKI